MNKQFKRIYLEITNICNLSCSFCPIDQREADSLDLEDFKKIIKQVSPIAEQVCLHLMGEPLAHKNISEVLKICSKEDALIQLTTNGLLLKKYTNLILSENCVRQVNISLQSYMDNYPEESLDNYLEMILDFINEAQKEKPDLYINLRLWNLKEASKKEQDDNEKVYKFFEEKLDIKINRNIELGAIKSKKLVNRLYLHFDSRFEWPRLELPFQSDQGRCNGLKDHIAIHADGTVVPCCLDDQKIINLGNCLEDPIENILNSKRAKNIKIGFEKNTRVEELCKRCSYINRFNK